MAKRTTRPQTLRIERRYEPDLERQVAAILLLLGWREERRAATDRTAEKEAGS